MNVKTKMTKKMKSGARNYRNEYNNDSIRYLESWMHVN